MLLHALGQTPGHHHRHGISQDLGAALDAVEHRDQECRDADHRIPQVVRQLYLVRIAALFHQVRRHVADGGDVEEWPQLGLEAAVPAAREALDARRALPQTAGDRVVVNERSTRKDRAWDEKRLAQVWRPAHKGTGIKYRNPYQLRHTFASQLLSQGENLAYISKLLGHKTVEMAQRTYARWISEGEKLGFDRPPREYGMALLADAAAREKRVNRV